MGIASGVRVRPDSHGKVMVTGSYTIIAQTEAEMMGLGMDKVTVQLGDSGFPISAAWAAANGMPTAPPNCPEGRGSPAGGA